MRKKQLFDDFRRKTQFFITRRQVLHEIILKRNSKGGGIILYIREDFPSRFLKALDVEDLLVECYFENKNGCSFLTLIPIKP